VLALRRALRDLAFGDPEPLSSHGSPPHLNGEQARVARPDARSADVSRGPREITRTVALSHPLTTEFSLPACFALSLALLFVIMA
jgi:hypothetical protein